MRFRVLDSLRGIAAILVALYHLSAAGYFFQIPLIRHGGIAVPLFFVLSGFVISHAYTTKLEKWGDFGSFMLRRVGRIYPLHIFTLLALIGIEVAKYVIVSKGAITGQDPFTGGNSIGSLVANLFLLQAIIPFGYYTWNGPSWSVSVEIYTNILFALVLIGAQGRSRRALNLAMLFSALTLIYVISFTELTNTSGRGFAECMFGFMCGNLAYRWHESVKATWVPGPLLEVLAAAVFFLMFWFDPVNEFFTLCVFGGMVFVFSFQCGPISKILSANALLFLGKVSYSIYLVHSVVLSVLYGVVRMLQAHYHQQLLYHVGISDVISLGPAYLMDALAVGYLAVVVGVAALCYKFVEEPGRDFFNRISRSLKTFRPQVETQHGV